MQILKTLAFCFLFAPFYFGQISFYNTYSDEGYDVGEGIVQLPDSSYLVTGSSSSFEGNSQAFIMKIDSLGNRLWSKDFGGFESDRGRRIFQVQNDGIYVAGQSNSFGNFYDAYFFKTDFSGNLLYEKHYGSSAYENIHDGLLLADTSFILVGETYNTANETEDIYLLRINRFGDTLWTKNFGSEQKDVARSIKLLNDSTVIIAGEYYVADSLTQKAMLIKMDLDGNVEWLKTYGDLRKYVFNDLTIENDEIRAVGYAVENSTNQIRAFYIKTNVEGDLLFFNIQQHVGDYSVEHIVKFGLTVDDYYFVSKITNSPEIPTYQDGPDVIIFKFDSNMDYNDMTSYPSYTGSDLSNAIIPTSDGGAILVGTNEFPSFNGSSVFLAKIGPNNYYPYNYLLPIQSSLVDIKEIDENLFELYPNPVETELSFLNLENYNVKITIHNQQGELKFYSDKVQEKLNIGFLNSGLYFVTIISPNEVYTQKIVVK